MAVLQNWSMHVKYASRHALYPVPNVFDWEVACVTVARADEWGRNGVVLVVVRPVRGVFAERAVDKVFVARDDVVPVDVRAVAVRVGVVPVDARDVVVCCAVRDAVVRAVPVVAIREIVFLFVVARDTVFASRTAASAMPIPTINAIRIYAVFFILIK